jgi:hypothetical protein
VDATLSALKDMSWTASLPFKGHFCLATDVFDETLETEYNLFEYTTSMYRRSNHIIRFNRLFTPLLVDSERILVAKVSSQIYSKLPNLLGIVPSLPMVLVDVFLPMMLTQESMLSNAN